MDLRQAMFIRLVNYPTSFFDNHRSGSLMSRFTYDVTQIKEASTNAVSTLVRDSLSVIGLLGWMFYICLLYTSPSPRDLSTSRMPSSA